MQDIQNSMRYQRQMLLPELGVTGQQKLVDASVLMVGAGGLGCPALQYLAAAGTGTIGIVDHDLISLSNLHRQILYKTADTGKSKARQAAMALQQLNPDIRIEVHDLELTSQNALDLFKNYDIIIDGTDNFATRYMISDACVLLDKPLVYGAVAQFEGQVALFNVAGTDGKKVSYRHLFPEPPAPGEVLNCAEAGVLGVLPGIIGTMQASEAIKLITGIGTPLINRLFTYNALNNQTYTFLLSDTETTNGPQDEAAFLAMDYQWLCGTENQETEEISPELFQQWIRDGSAAIIDVREKGEQPQIHSFAHLQMPLSALTTGIPAIEAEVIIVFCQSGVRSRQAARLMRAEWGNAKKVYSLKGGMLSTFIN